MKRLGKKWGNAATSGSGTCVYLRAGVGRKVLWYGQIVVVVVLAGCESQKSAPSTQQAYEPADGRNLAPAIQPYADDPLFPYNEPHGGGGRAR